MEEFFLVGDGIVVCCNGMENGVVKEGEETGLYFSVGS